MRSIVIVLGPALVSVTLSAMAACGAPAETADTASTTGGVDGAPTEPATGADASAGAQSDDASIGDAALADGGAAQCPMLALNLGPSSKWAYVDMPGHLAYGTLPTGERLLDFSSAGYMGGGVAIPSVPVQETVNPSGGADDTPAIQAAINAVSILPATGGLRGAVLLAPGTFTLAGSLSITTSGVVLRGSGSGAGGTIVQISGTPRTVFTIGGTGAWQESTTSDEITDDYVPSGATTFHVAATTGLSPGTPVLVDRPVTAAWIHFMGMDTLVRDDAGQTWLPAGSVIHADRTIIAVSGNTVTLDAPLSDTFDYATWGAGAPHASVSPYTFPGRIEQVGLESMRLVAPEQIVPISEPTYGLLDMGAVQNAWVSDVEGDEFTGGFVVESGAKWVTIQDSRVIRVAPIDAGAGYPFHYSIDGQGILVQRCTSSGMGVYSYGTEDRTSGPNVVLNMTMLDGDGGGKNALEPHMRWATGVLVDSVNAGTTGDTRIDLMNEGTAGSGHGWAIGFGVVWNSEAVSLLVQQPPGSQNWSIGTTGLERTSSEPGILPAGPVLPQGIIDSPGTAVAPQSLYLAQLCERLGPGALKAIGY
ncbi:MAG: hypothetical protein ACLQVI_01565 [Polyangiaceae bacterium]